MASTDFRGIDILPCLIYGSTVSGRSSEEEKIIDALRDFGLTRLQAEVYLTLRRLGSAYARELIAELKANRVDIYRALRTLRNLELVEVQLGNPTRFQSVAPRNAIEALLNRKEEALANLKERGKEILPKLEALTQEPKAFTRTEKRLFLRLLSGAQVFRRVADLVKDARYVLKMISPRGLYLHWQSGIYDAETLSVQRGAKIRILTYIGKQNVECVREYSNIASIRHLDDLAARIRYIVVDENQLVLPVSSPPQGLKDPVVIWSNSSTLIDSLLHDFDAAWMKGVDAEKRINELCK
ncbi:MAG: helix-turn-helix domain-containing protein [Nitrososphaerales archaeon]